MIKKILLIVLTIIIYITLWSVSYYFAYNATIPYRDNSYFNEKVFPLYEDDKKESDELFLSRYLGQKNAFYSKNKLYNYSIKNYKDIQELSFSIYPIYFTNGKKGSFIFIDKFKYYFNGTIIDLNFRNRSNPGYEFYKQNFNALDKPVYVQFRTKNSDVYTNARILDPFQINYFLEDSFELEAFRLTTSPTFEPDNLLLSFATKENSLDPFSIIIGKRLVPEKLEKKGWPSKNIVQKNNLLFEKPDYSNYNGTTIKVMLLMTLLFVILTYLLFFHRIVFNKIRYKYKGKSTL